MLEKKLMSSMIKIINTRYLNIYINSYNNKKVETFTFKNKLNQSEGDEGFTLVLKTLYNSQERITSLQEISAQLF